MDGPEFRKPDRRRRRPALACVMCRKSKIRCDRNMPCSACVRSKHKTCVYEPAPTKVNRKRAATAATATAEASGSASPREVGGGEIPISPAASSLSPSIIDNTAIEDDIIFNRAAKQSQVASAHDVDTLQLRVKDLEQQLQAARVVTSQPNVLFNAPKPPDVAKLQVTYPTYLTDDIHTMSRSVMSKTRYFGQSHWMNIVHFLKPIMKVFESAVMEAKSEIVMLLHQNKLLGKTIKAQRMPQLTFNFGLSIPSRDVADKLVDGYLRTMESVYRILHVPSFRAEYEKYWTSRESVSQAFVIQLQLVMAVGAGVYDDIHSMRKAAIAWVYEAQCWLITPPQKSKLTVTGLQNLLLLHLAREVAGVSGDLTWISTGSLLRSAIAMGLHRDPRRLPKMDRMQAEMRRRLWNTTLELTLQSSLNGGAPPMISLDEFDTGSPSDCDDSDLEGGDENQSNPPVATKERFTDMSVALALRKSFPIRLAIVKQLNDLNSLAKYDDTLKLHTQLQAAYKAAALSLKRLDGDGTSSGGRQPSQFQREFMNFIFHHYFQAHHLPYLGRSFREPAYAFSRKVAIEMSLKLFSVVSESSSYGYPVGNGGGSGPIQEPSPPFSAGSSTTAATPHDDNTTNTHNDLHRLAINSSGFFRNVTSKASMLIPLELQHLAMEDAGLGLVTPRPDLLAAARETPGWARRRIRSGETNIKGYILGCAIFRYVEGLAAGLDVQDLYAPCMKAATEGAREAGNMLREMLARQDGGDETTLDQQGTAGAGHLLAGGEFGAEGMDIDWDLDMSTALFEVTTIDDGFPMPGEPDLGLFNYGFDTAT